MDNGWIKGECFMSLSKKEKKAMLNARLRNMKRKYAKLSNHAEFAEDCIDLKCEIDSLERELKSL